MSKLLQKCIEAGLKLTDQRKAIIRVLEESMDHPSVETLCERAKRMDPSVSIATVYRTLGLLDELGLILKHDFGGDITRFEVKPTHENEHNHHHHLIDIDSGAVLEFANEELERLTTKIATDLGYEIIDHTFEIFGRKIKK